MPADNRTASVPKHLDRLWLAVGLVLLSAFALRVYALGAQSLWNDEGTSVALASRSLEAIADGAAKDIHPPLYYILLHFWMPLSGESEYAVRFLSVIAGMLVVVFTVRLARDFFGQEAMLAAALLSALSPFQIYYSQETRMYIWVALWSAMSVWAAIGDWRIEIGDQNAPFNPQSPISNLQSPISIPPISILYVGATVAALYTHYFAPAVIVAENLAFAVWWLIPRRNIRRKFSSLAHWLIGQLVIVLAFLPWYLYAGNQLAAWPSISEPFDLATLLWRVLNVYSIGLSLEGTAATIVALLLGVLLVIGLLPERIGWAGSAELLQSRQPTSPPSPAVMGVSCLHLFGGSHHMTVGDPSPKGEGRQLLPFPAGKGPGVRSASASSDFLAGRATALLALWLLVPVGVMYFISLSRPAYNPKFLLLATPPFFILVAHGLSQLWARLVRYDWETERPWVTSICSVLAVGILAAVGFFPSLRNYYMDPRYARDDYRGIMQYVDAHAQAGDGLLIDAPGQSEVVRYYQRGEEQLYPLPNGRPPDPVQTRAAVDEMLTQVRRLYAIYWATDQADPERIIEARLAEQAFKARDEWHGNVRLAIYGVAPSARRPIQVIDAEFGGEIVFAGYQVDAEEMRAGDLLTLTLHWKAEQVPSARYKVFVHLLDAENHVVGQRDGEPVGDLRLTTTWRAGEAIADNYGILVEPETPPGEYRVEVGMYRADSGARLPIFGRNRQAMGDAMIITNVRVIR